MTIHGNRVSLRAIDGRDRSPRTRRGLTLVEVLLAVFILGIGVISIAALFPAGIALQRQSSDDAIGALVADNAVALLRTRIDRTAFGPPSFGANQPAVTVPAGIPGDFGWARPGFVTANNGTTVSGLEIPKGSILIFNPNAGPSSVGGATPSEVPWNETLYGNAPPNIVFTQRDRYWPMLPTYTFNEIERPRPQYVWEAMFRRFQGRIQVAIFVYRVTRPVGESGLYVVQANPSQPTVPPVPIRLALGGGGPFGTFGPGGLDGNITTRDDNATIPGTEAGSAFDLGNDAFAWQLPGQWMLDQNNSVHRVLQGRRRQSDGPVVLRGPAPILAHSFAHAAPGDPLPIPVEEIWFMPIKDNAGNTLTPVFVTVREL